MSVFIPTTFPVLNSIPFMALTYSVREWIQCMQVCCQSKTTHSYSPSSSLPHSYTPPIFLPSHHHTSTVYTSPSTLTYFPLPDLQSMTSQVGAVPWPHPSTLANYPSTTRWALNGTNTSTGVAVDTGYVSGDPSPAAFTQLVRHI